MELKIFLAGFGNVGRAFTALIGEKGTELLGSYGLDLKLVGVATRSKGTAFNERSLDIPRLLASEKLTGRVDSSAQEGVSVGMPASAMIQNLDYDLLVECTSADLYKGEPSSSYMMETLRRGRHVVTSNKGPLFYNYHNLQKVALAKGAEFLFEGTVMTGTPVFSLFQRCLRGSRVLNIEGVLNGTSNFILEMMRRGSSFEKALMEVQRRGYAEPDPSLDVDGWDSASKASILAQVLMGAPFTPFSDIQVEGVRSIDPDLFLQAERIGGSVRLVCRVEKREGFHSISVRPEILPSNHPLCSISGITNGILFMTDSLGEVCISGAGAGPFQTAQAILMDILSLAGS